MTTPPIPRRAAMVWLQGWDKMPDHLTELVESFQTHNNGTWKLDRWDDERIRDELNLGPGHAAYMLANELVPPDSVHQLRADIARYAILRSFGGLTVDVDYRWFRPIDDLIGHHHAVGVYEVNGTWVANGFLATTPGHLLAHRALNAIPERIKTTAGKGLRANAITGPKHLTRIIDRLPLAAKPFIHTSDRLLAVPWNHPERADDPRFQELYPAAYGAHLWQHQRGLRGLDEGKWKTW